MGWFWADNAPLRSDLREGRMRQPRQQSPHPMPMGGMEPPPECPMHNAAKPSTPAPSTPAACPYNPPSKAESQQAPPSYISKLNPLNYMPSSISNTRETDLQSVNLPLSREPSSIPRGDGQGNWEYPSPQQMYNAMLRKGYTNTPAEHVESMVAVHNFLNEGAWEEIKEWERRFASGLGQGWEYSKLGEENAARKAALDEFRRSRSQQSDSSEPKLLRFMGRPSEPTPKARMLGFMAWLYPAQFPDNPPFDRHDWFVQRQVPGGGQKEVRYVIDYYSGPPEPTGEPVFYLDVRPAVDGPRAAAERLVRWGGDVWWRASGGSVREEGERAKRQRA